MKIALAQMNMERELGNNCRKSIHLMHEAAVNGAELIVFPEIQLTPFFPQYEDQDVSSYVMEPNHPYLEEIRKSCREHHIFAVPNLYIREDGKNYDRSFLIDDQGRIIGTQDMVHIAQCEKFYEQSYYEPSKGGFSVFDTRLGKIGIVVCFDRHYPESIRSEALQGAELIVIPTANTAEEPSVLFQWEVRVQAFQNSVNIAMCNRVGTEDAMEFSGESLVSDFHGTLVACAGEEEELLFSEMDLPGASAERVKLPYTRLRRPECYE